MPKAMVATMTTASPCWKRLLVGFARRLVHTRVIGKRVIAEALEPGSGLLGFSLRQAVDDAAFALVPRQKIFSCARGLSFSSMA
jgi:hypothetical protein